MDEIESGMRYRRYVGEHYREQILVEDLLKLGTLTYRQTLELFNREMGSDRGLWDYVDRIRILYAAGFMRRTRISTEEIAAFVKIPRAGSFERLFRKFMGEEPATYRKHLSDRIDGLDELPRFEEDLLLLKEKRREPLSAEDYCRKTERYIDAHPEADLHIPVLAARVGISGSYLSGIFRMYRKTTLQHYIMKKRLQKACDLLLYTELDIERIGKSIGYPDRKRFEAFFCRQLHQMPAAWRKIHRI